MNRKIFWAVFVLPLAAAILFAIKNIWLANNQHLGNLQNSRLEKPTLSATLRPLPTSTPIPIFTTSSIFSSNHIWVNDLPADQTISIITTGDVMPGRTVNAKMHQYQDFTHPFTQTAHQLAETDFTIINLESPLVPDCPVVSGGMTFCGDYRFIEGLKFAGVDAANLANNHINNYGQKGINQTISILENNQILPVGWPLNELKIATVKNTKIGLLGYDLLSGFDEKAILSTISASSKKVDILVINLHWGIEYTHLPQQFQRDLAYRIIDEGADLVVGNHSHWFQPLEVYKEKLIVYSHGNFVFDQEWSEETKTGIIVKHTFYHNNQVDARVFPVYITDYHQPEFLTGQPAENILNQLNKL